MFACKGDFIFPFDTEKSEIVFVDVFDHDSFVDHHIKTVSFPLNIKDIQGYPYVNASRDNVNVRYSFVYLHTEQDKEIIRLNAFEEIKKEVCNMIASKSHYG